tara:strand:- start:118 stop:300 length:183 start_codon:yes stop_codon:yes gene_type:complete
MKNYKHVILRSTSGNKINIPKEVWKNLGWNLNDKLKLRYSFNSPSDQANPVSLHIELAEK